jgi:hypothetical protein
MSSPEIGTVFGSEQMPANRYPYDRIKIRPGRRENALFFVLQNNITALVMGTLSLSPPGTVGTRETLKDSESIKVLPQPTFRPGSGEDEYGVLEEPEYDCAGAKSSRSELRRPGNRAAQTAKDRAAGLPGLEQDHL